MASALAGIKPAHTALGLVVVAGAVWYLWGTGGKAHGVTLDPVYDTAAYNPYAWWQNHSRGNAYVHHYPSTVGPNCLPVVLQNEQGAISTTGNEGQEDREAVYGG